MLVYKIELRPKDQELLSAIKQNNFPKVKGALEVGARLTITDSKGQPILNLAMRHASAEVIKYLLDKGVSPNSKDVSNGMTAVHEAALHGRVEGIKALIDRGAHINVKDKAGYTPLRYAKEKKSPAIVKILIDAEAKEFRQPRGIIPVSGPLRPLQGLPSIIQINSGSLSFFQPPKQQIIAIPNPDKKQKGDKKDDKRKGGTEIKIEVSPNDIGVKGKYKDKENTTTVGLGVNPKTKKPKVKIEHEYESNKGSRCYGGGSYSSKDDWEVKIGYSSSCSIM